MSPRESSARPLAAFVGGAIGLTIGLAVAGAGLALTETTMQGEPPDAQFWSGENLPPDCDVFVKPGLRVCSETGR